MANTNPNSILACALVKAKQIVNNNNRNVNGLSVNVANTNAAGSVFQDFIRATDNYFNSSAVNTATSPDDAHREQFAIHSFQQLSENEEYGEEFQAALEEYENRTIPTPDYVRSTSDFCRLFGCTSVSELKTTFEETNIIDFEKLENGTYTEQELRSIAFDLQEAVRDMERQNEISQFEASAQEIASLDIDSYDFNNIVNYAVSRGVPEEYAKYFVISSINDNIHNTFYAEDEANPDIRFEIMDGKICFLKDDEELFDLETYFDDYGFADTISWLRGDTIRNYCDYLGTSDPEKHALMEAFRFNPYEADSLLISNYGGDARKAAEALQATLNGAQEICNSDVWFYSGAEVLYDENTEEITIQYDGKEETFSDFLLNFSYIDSSATYMFFISMAQYAPDIESASKLDALNGLVVGNSTIAEDIDDGTSLVRDIFDAETGEEALNIICAKYCSGNMEVAQRVYKYLLGNNESQDINSDNPFNGRNIADLMSKLYTNCGTRYVLNQNLLNCFTETEVYDYDDNGKPLYRPTQEYYTNIEGEVCVLNWNYSEEYGHESITLSFEEDDSTRELKFYQETNLIGERYYYIYPNDENQEVIEESEEQFLKRLAVAQNYGILQATDFDLADDDLSQSTEKIDECYIILNDYDNNISETLTSLTRQFGTEGLIDDARNWISETFSIGLSKEDILREVEAETQHTTIMAYYTNGQTELAQSMVEEELNRRLQSSGNIEETYKILCDYYGADIAKDIIENIDLNTDDSFDIAYNVAQDSEWTRFSQYRFVFDDENNICVEYYNEKEKRYIALQNQALALEEAEEYEYHRLNVEQINEISSIASEFAIPIEQAYRFLTNGGEAFDPEIREAYNTASSLFTDYNTTLAYGNALTECQTPEEAFKLITGKDITSSTITQDDIDTFNQYYGFYHYYNHAVMKEGYSPLYSYEYESPEDADEYLSYQAFITVEARRNERTGKYEIVYNEWVNPQEQPGYFNIPDGWPEEQDYIREEHGFYLTRSSTNPADLLGEEGDCFSEDNYIEEFFSVINNGYCNDIARSEYSGSTICDRIQEQKFNEFYEENREQIDTYIDNYAAWATTDSESRKHFAEVIGVGQNDLTPELIARYIKETEGALYAESCKYMQYSYTTAKQAVFGESTLDAMTSQYCMEMKTYAANLSHMISMGCMIASVVFPAAAPALMTAAKFAGYIDNAIDLINMLTNHQNYMDDDYFGWAKTTGFEWLTKRGYRFFSNVAGDKAELFTKWLVDRTGGTTSYLANHALAQILVRGSSEAFIETAICIPWTMGIKAIQGGQYDILAELQENFIYDFLPYARGWQDLFIGRVDTTLYGGDGNYYRINGSDEIVKIDPDNGGRIIGVFASVADIGGENERPLVSYEYGENDSVRITKYKSDGSIEEVRTHEVSGSTSTIRIYGGVGSDGEPDPDKLKQTTETTIAGGTTTVRYIEYVNGNPVVKSVTVSEELPNGANRVTYYNGLDENNQPTGVRQTIVTQDTQDGTVIKYYNGVVPDDSTEPNRIETKDAKGRLRSVQEGNTTVEYARSGVRTRLTINNGNDDITVEYRNTWTGQTATITAGNSVLTYKVGADGEAYYEVEGSDERIPFDEQALLRAVSSGTSLYDIQRNIVDGNSRGNVGAEADIVEADKVQGELDTQRPVKTTEQDNSADERPEFSQTQYDRAISNGLDVEDAERIANAGLSDEQFERLNSIREKYQDVSIDEAISIAKANLSPDQEKLFEDLYNPDYRAIFANASTEDLLAMASIPSVKNINDAMTVYFVTETYGVSLSLAIEMYKNFDSNQIDVAQKILFTCQTIGYTDIDINKLTQLVEWKEKNNGLSNEVMLDKIVAKVALYSINPDVAVRLIGYGLDDATEQRYCDICAQSGLPICDTTLELVKSNLTEDQLNEAISYHKEYNVPISAAIKLTQATEDERRAFLENFEDLRNMLNDKGEPLFGVRVTQEIAEREHQNNDKDVVQIGDNYYIMYSNGLAYVAKNGQNSEIFIDMVREGYLPTRVLFSMPEGGESSEYIDEDIARLCAAYELVPRVSTNFDSEEELEEGLRTFRFNSGELVQVGAGAESKIYIIDESGRAVELTDEDKQVLLQEAISATFVPKFTSEADVRAALDEGSFRLTDEGASIPIKLGDVIELEGHSRPCIINPDGSLTEINMSKETYLTLFPPVERYSTVQFAISNCWELSGYNATFRDPAARHFILDMFSEDESGNITITYPRSGRSYTFAGGQLPEGTNMNYYSKGAPAVQMLEWADGREIQAERRAAFLENGISDADRQRYINDGLMDTDGNFTDKAYINGDGELVARDNSFPSVYEQSRNFGKSTDFFNRIGMDSELYYPQASSDGFNGLPSTIQSDLSDPRFFENNIVVIGTPSKPGARAESDLLPELGIISNHAYQIVPGEVAEDGTIRTYLLYNPHGTLQVELDVDTFKRYVYTVSVASKYSDGTEEYSVGKPDVGLTGAAGDDVVRPIGETEGDRLYAQDDVARPANLETQLDTADRQTASVFEMDPSLNQERLFQGALTLGYVRLNPDNSINEESMRVFLETFDLSSCQKIAYIQQTYPQLDKKDFAKLMGIYETQEDIIQNADNIRVWLENKDTYYEWAREIVLSGAPLVDDTSSLIARAAGIDAIDGAEIRARVKEIESAYDKIVKKVLQGVDIPEFDAAQERIADLIGTRIVLDDASSENTHQIAVNLAQAIIDRKIIITDIHNYSNGSEKYWSDEDIELIKRASAQVGIEVRVLQEEQTSRSGYVCAQMNIQTVAEDGTLGPRGELQIRSALMDVCSELEHITYDIYEGKNITKDLPELEELFSPVTFAYNRLIKNGLKSEYDNYVLECYQYARNFELGLIEGEFRLPAFPLCLSEYSILSWESLEDINAEAHRIKDEHGIS